jgi:predicted nucleic acid-binding protein
MPDLTLDDQNHYPARAVVDTCVILNVALGDHDNLSPEKLERSKKLLNDAIAGKLRLFLPSICLIELSSWNIITSGQKTPDMQENRLKKRRINQWCADSEFVMADLTADGALWYSESPELQNIKAGDSSVLATAKFAHATTIYTWDDKLINAVRRANGINDSGITAVNPPELPLALLSEDEVEA